MMRPSEALYDAVEALERRLRPQVSAPSGQAGRRSVLRSPRLASPAPTLSPRGGTRRAHGPLRTSAGQMVTGACCWFEEYSSGSVHLGICLRLLLLSRPKALSR
jgi:hypothetical protein